MLGCLHLRGAPYQGAPPQGYLHLKSAANSGYLHFRGILTLWAPPDQGCLHLRNISTQGDPTSGVSPSQRSPISRCLHFRGISRSWVPHLRVSHLLGAFTSGVSHLKWHLISGMPHIWVPHLRVSHLRGSSPQGYPYFGALYLRVSHLRGSSHHRCPIPKCTTSGHPTSGVPLFWDSPPQGVPPEGFLASGVPHTRVPHLRAYPRPRTPCLVVPRGQAWSPLYLCACR